MPHRATPIHSAASMAAQDLSIGDWKRWREQSKDHQQLRPQVSPVSCSCCNTAVMWPWLGSQSRAFGTPRANDNQRGKSTLSVRCRTWQHWTKRSQMQIKQAEPGINSRPGSSPSSISSSEQMVLARQHHPKVRHCPPACRHSTSKSLACDSAAHLPLHNVCLCRSAARTPCCCAARSRCCSKQNKHTKARGAVPHQAPSWQQGWPGIATATAPAPAAATTAWRPRHAACCAGRACSGFRACHGQPWPCTSSSQDAGRPTAEVAAHYRMDLT